MSYRHVFAAILVLVALAVPAAADEWEKKFAVTGTPDIRVQGSDAHIRVAPWDRNEVHARVFTEGWRISDDEVRITAQQAGDSISLEIRIPRTEWGFRVGRRSIQIELMVPRRTDLTAYTSDGNVAVSSLQGRFDLRTSDGRMTVNELKGQIRLRTSDGDIEATAMEGRLEATGSDGNIRVRGRFDELTIRTSDGNIEADVLPGSKLAATWSLKTSDGNMILRLPPELDAELDAHVSDGRIHLGFPVNVHGELSRTRVMAKLNAGGLAIQLRSSDGSIHLERL
jgi:DUF4097 and DUF4098 domain-containing protein YvlB